MKVVVTGREGQVARALAERNEDWPGIDLTFLARPEFDLAAAENVHAEILRLGPDAVVNVAAYTAVDQAETETELAQTINGDAAGQLAEAARQLGVPIIQISTDYVFDGDAQHPYREGDPVGPVTAYGRTKLRGEELVERNNPKHVILRTAWVYSPFGKNFVKSILSRAVELQQLSVVSDQLGNPTSAFDIAEAIFRVLTKLLGEVEGSDYGTYHLVGAEEASWFDFASEIVRQSGFDAPISPVSTDAFPTTAKRPANSRLDSSKFTARFGFAPSGYRDGLRDVLPRLLESAG